MAIKVGGTTVVDDSRQLTNIASVDATTVAALGAAGVGAGGGSLEATASGTLPNGDAVIVKSDGTVSVVTGVSQNIGTQSTIINNSNTEYYHADYDTTANKLILAYPDTTDSSSGYVVAGTISNETITFGTPLKFTGDSINMVRVVYDSSANKTVVFWRRVTNQDLKYTVCTVSGSTMNTSFSGTVTSASTDWFNVTYDSNINRIILFREDNNYGVSIICELDASSITFFQDTYDSNTYHDSVNAVFNTSNNKICVLYGVSNQLYIKMGTPTALADGINWGNSQTVGSGNEAGMAYDPDSNKLVIAYKDSSFSPNRGTIKTATVNANGVDLDFSSPSYFLSGSPVPNGLTNGIVYDTAANKTLVSWTDSSTNYPYITPVEIDSSGNIILGSNTLVYSGDGYQPEAVFCEGTTDRTFLMYKDVASGRIIKSNVIQLGSTDLTDTNFIGFSDGSYTNGQTATVLINGSVTESQTGLTPATKYYVDGSGSLTTSATGNVYAGIAVASTKLIVKG